MLLLLGIPVGIVLLALLFSMMYLRVVVNTNEVHIIQSAKATVSYGKDQKLGNKYYRWPSWVPYIGVKVSVLPVSVFQLSLSDYAAYDKGRVPFIIDIISFFRVVDSNTAAARIANIKEMDGQLTNILKGAIRTILASSEIEEILEGRSKFGEMFTTEVDHELLEWGIKNVKNIELMDIRDSQGSQVIANIMAKKKSLIEKDSRVAVALNHQLAETAEIEAGRIVGVNKQEAEKQVGIASAVKDRDVGVAKQQADQTVKEQEKLTKEKEMAVKQVGTVREAEITKLAAIVKAEQEKSVATTVAEGTLNATKLHAAGIEAEGNAKGQAETAILMAPVNAQITLAKEIGENSGYQDYLVTVKRIEATQAVGIEQAKALEKADVKVISNTGHPVEGITNVMDLFNAKGGLSVGAMLEALNNTETGAKVLSALGVAKKPEPFTGFAGIEGKPKLNGAVAS